MTASAPHVQAEATIAAHREMACQWIGFLTEQDVRRRLGIYRAFSDEDLAADCCANRFNPDDDRPRHEWFDEVALVAAFRYQRERDVAHAIGAWWSSLLDDDGEHTHRVLEDAFRKLPTSDVGVLVVPENTGPGCYLVFAKVSGPAGMLYVEASDDRCLVFRSSDLGEENSTAHECRANLQYADLKGAAARLVLAHWVRDEKGMGIECDVEGAIMASGVTAPNWGIRRLQQMNPR